jgi:methylthioribose-1-phosphate isomerase
MIETVRWREGCVRLLDQTLLPHEECYLDLRSVEAVFEAIRSLRVRGAPAIGIAAAYGVALGAWLAHESGGDARSGAQGAIDHLRSSRPTAVNLFWALDRMSRRLEVSPATDLVATLVREADAILEEDLEMSRRMGEHGRLLLPSSPRVLTHCNTGGLATGGLGTALAVVYAVAAAGGTPHVFADETRPLLQGARLTSWELVRATIPVTVLADGAAAWALRTQAIDAVFIGADRIAANGDTANKIGSLGVALAAREARVPFYVVAPSSTIDPHTPSGAAISIEERAAGEVCTLGGRTITPEGVGVFNPAFDITPRELITAIITDRGVFRPPFDDLVRPIGAAP